MSDMNNSGRVTTREFYDALIEQNTLREKANGKIHEKLDTIASSLATSDEMFKSVNTKVDSSCKRLDKRIDENVAAITKVRNINTFIALLGSSIAGFLGMRQ